MLIIIIENGVRHTQTPAGVRVPAVIDTKLSQKLQDPGQEEPLIMPDGTLLEGVEVQFYSPDHQNSATDTFIHQK